jgi:crotonobetainyl-CoA:carnitine CoA-transferase CaiB-like acyl-CoA transferase
MAQALGGIAEAYSTPGQPMKIGVVSVADETCAILAFGGMLAALHCARTQGIGQKVECSLLGGQIRLMGWTLTTAMWRNGLIPAGWPSSSQSIRMIRRWPMSSPIGRRRRAPSASGS